MIELICLYFTFTEAIYTYLYECGVKGFDRSNKSDEQLYKEIFEALSLLLLYSDNKYETFKIAHDRLGAIDDLIGRGYHGINKLHQEIQQQKLEKCELDQNNLTGNNFDGKPCNSCGSLVFHKNCESLHNSNHLDVCRSDDKKILEYFQKKNSVSKRYV